SYSGIASVTTGQSGSPCTYTISPASASVAAAGGSGTLTVTSASTCSWTPSSSAPAWLTCTPANGTGSGSVTWSVAANTSASLRTATLNIAGQTFTVSQAAAAAGGPADDNCANGAGISGSSATLTGSNVGATKETGEPY